MACRRDNQRACTAMCRLHGGDIPSVRVGYGEKKDLIPSNSYWELLWRCFRTWLSEKKTTASVLGREAKYFTWSGVCEQQVPVADESQKGCENDNKLLSQNRQVRDVPSISLRILSGPSALCHLYHLSSHSHPSCFALYLLTNYLCWK